MQYGTAYRLGALLTHPVQYYSPLFRELAARPGIDLTVFYAHRPNAEEQGTGFGIPFQWDTDVLGGYDYQWLGNRARRPSVDAFAGCNTPRIAEVVSRGSFDAFLVFGWHSLTYWQGFLACWRTGVPVVVRGDSILIPPVGARAAARAAKAGIKRVVYPHFIRRFAACLSVGVRSDAYFAHYGARRIVRSPHFVDNAAFARVAGEAALQRSAHRAEWGIPPNAFVVVFSGKLIDRKRPLDLIRAAAAARTRSLVLLFVGDGGLRGECERLAAGLGVAARFLGFINQRAIGRAYAVADILVLPSGFDTWGLVVNEAMACGLPAIVSDVVGCAPDLIRPGETGDTYPVCDVAALALHLRTLSAAPDRTATWGRAARSHIARFSVEAAADGVEAALTVTRAKRR